MFLDLLFELLLLGEESLSQFVSLHVLDRVDQAVFLGVHVLSDLVAELPLEFGQLSDHKARGVIVVAHGGKSRVLVEVRGDDGATLGHRVSD